ncbi:PAS domain S-box protein, partial [Bacteroidetes/Chlorobi group bacterium ChocPot_Mid]
MDNEKVIESVLENTDAAFGLHKVVLDKKGNPIDYIFEKVNKNFEKYTGLNHLDIIGKKVTEVLPEIEKSNFDWIKKYGEVALTGKSIKFEAFSESLNRYYTVLAFSPEKYYFITLFHEISERKSRELLNELQQENFEYLTLNKVITDISKMQTKDEVFHYLIEFISGLMPESVILSLEKIDEDNLRLKEVKGLEKNIVKKVIDLAGVDFFSKPFKIIPEFREIFSQTRLYEHKEGLEKFAKSEIPASIAKAIQKLLGIKSIYTIGLVSDNKYIGNFHFFLRGKDTINQQLIENLFYQSALVIEKIAENLKNKELLNNFLTFYNALQDFVFVVDMQGNIKYANEYAKEHLGYAFEEFTKMRITSLCNEQNESDFREIVNSKNENSEADKRIYECTYFSKDGKSIPIEMIIYRGIWGEEEIFYFIGKDLTKVQLSENKFKLIFNNNPSPMSISELSRGIFIDVNEAFLKAIKCKREDIIGKSSLEVNLYESPEERRNILEKVIKDKNISNYKFNFRTFDSEIRSCLLSAEVIEINNVNYLVSTFVDITERIQLENRIKEINKKLFEENNLFQNGPVVLFKLRREKHYPIAFVSDNINELTGYSTNEIKEHNISLIDLVHYLDREKVIKEIEESLEDPTKVYINHSEFRLNTKDERLTWVNLFTMIIRDDNGGVKELLGYTYDITATKKSEENLQTTLK